MGEAGADTITLGTGGSVAGIVDGGADGATLSYDGRTTAVNVALTDLGSEMGFTGTATGTDRFENIIELVGSSSTNVDTLTGRDIATTWTIATANAGTLVETRTLTFSAVESLTGGSAIDTFNINAALAGSIMGGGADDILTLNTGGLVSGDVDMGAGNDVIMALGGRVVGTLDGGANVDRLQGPDAATTWMANGATVTVGGMDLTPTNIEVLAGWQRY